MPAPLQGQASVLTQTPFSPFLTKEEGRLLPNDSRDYREGRKDHFLAPMPCIGACFLVLHLCENMRHISCLSLVRFLDLSLKRTNTTHFIQKRELWTH
jgi:hypothetical protein